MFLSRLGQAALVLLHRVELTVVLQHLSNAFSDTALLMVVKERSASASHPGLSQENSQQKALSDFYMIYILIIKLVPILPALLLARLGDRGQRRAPIVVSLSGYLVVRVGLLLLVLFHLPLEAMFGFVALCELGGGFCVFWSSVMTLTSIGTTAEERSKVGAGSAVVARGFLWQPGAKDIQVFCWCFMCRLFFSGFCLHY